MAKVKITIGGDPRKGRCYCKWVKEVDPDATNGYGLKGEFLRNGREYELPEGAVLLFVEEKGSWKHHRSYATVMQVEGGELKTRLQTEYANFITVRDKLLELLNQKPNPLAGFNDEDLIAELERRGYEIKPKKV